MCSVGFSAATAWARHEGGGSLTSDSSLPPPRRSISTSMASASASASASSPSSLGPTAATTTTTTITQPLTNTTATTNNINNTTTHHYHHTIIIQSQSARDNHTSAGRGMVLVQYYRVVTPLKKIQHCGWISSLACGHRLSGHVVPVADKPEVPRNINGENEPPMFFFGSRQCGCAPVYSQSIVHLAATYAPRNHRSFDL